MKLIPLLISVLPGLAQHVNQAVLKDPKPEVSNCNANQHVNQAVLKDPKPEVSTCKAKDIWSMSVPRDCNCSSGSTDCTKLEYKCTNPDRIIHAKSGLKMKTASGPCYYDDNVSCNSCYVWFDELCQCIQDILYSHPTNCKNSSVFNTIIPVWMLLEKQRLITTNLPLYGIEDLHYADPYADDGWLFGQKHYNRSTQALAMNSKASRTQEQIHIHVCDIKNQPCNQSGRTRDILSCLDRGHYKNMESVPLMPGDTKCKVANNTGSPIDIAEDIKREMQKDCNVYIGAGIITDRKDYTWACVTDSPQAAEWIYCN